MVQRGRVSAQMLVAEGRDEVEGKLELQRFLGVDDIISGESSSGW